jgi:Glycosyl transferase family 2
MTNIGSTATSSSLTTPVGPLQPFDPSNGTMPTKGLSDRWKHQQQQQQQQHRRNSNFSLSIKALIVTVLLSMNVFFVDLKVFSRKGDGIVVVTDPGTDVDVAETVKEMGDFDDSLATFAGKEAQPIVNTNGTSGRDDEKEAQPLLQHVVVSEEQESGIYETMGSKTSAENLQSQLSHDTFSACLLIKDDNDLLNEWLAYHYHVLTLRYLLVAVDPSSAKSPTPIFDKWRNLTDLIIVEWSDPNFMPEVFLSTGYHISPDPIEKNATKSHTREGNEDEEKVKADNLQITNHRFRQVTFLASCLKHMRDRNNTWTMHIDTDEFVVVNPLLRNTTQANVQMIRIPEIQEKGSIFQVVKQYYQDTNLRQEFNYPCITMPRLLFGSVEFEDNFTVPHDMPHYFNSSMLETIRWQYHTDYDDKGRNGQRKVMVDVSVVNRSNDMFNKPFSIHRPSGKLCPRIDQLDFRQLQRYPITVNHYIGSWERYFAKSDARRSERAYNAKAHVAAGHDNWMSPWLAGFVNHVGSERAKVLLQEYMSDTTSNSYGINKTANQVSPFAF